MEKQNKNLKKIIKQIKDLAEEVYREQGSRFYEKETQLEIKEIKLE